MSVEINVELGVAGQASTDNAVETKKDDIVQQASGDQTAVPETSPNSASPATLPPPVGDEPIETSNPTAQTSDTQSARDATGDKKEENEQETKAEDEKDKDKDKEKENESEKEKKDGNETQQLNDTKDKEEKEGEGGTMVGNALSQVKKFSNWECIAFFIFLIVFCVMAALSRGLDDTPFIQTAAIRNRLTIEKYGDGFNKTFDRQLEDTNQVMDIWNYLRDVVLRVMLVETTPSGNANNTEISNSAQMYYPLGQARLLGGIRLRQIRNKPRSCEIANDSFPRCWSTTTDTSDFNGNYKKHFPTYKYKTSSELEDVSWRAKYGSYEGGGYVHDFPLDYKIALNDTWNLQAGDWIDQGTAFVCIDFNLYNPTTNYHTIGRVAFEMPVGGVFPYFEIKSWKFLRYADSQGPALIALQIIWVVLILNFTVIMAVEMFREGCGCTKAGYWGKTRWRILDFLNYGFLYGAIFVFIYNETYRHKAGHDWKNIDSYQSFRKLQYLFLSETYILALNGFFSFFKLFKYFSVNRRLKFFFTMLGKAGQDLLMFILVLVIFFFGFGFCGFMAFSSDVDDFRSLVFAFFNMIRFVIGDVNYAALQLSSRTWGSVYYVAWSILMLLVLTNVFIAILSEAYGETIEEMSEEDKLSLGFFGMRGAMMRIQQIFKNLRNVALADLDEDGDGQLDAHELANKTGWTVEDAQKFIDEHDKDKNGKLSEKEWETLMKEAEEKKQQNNMDNRLAAIGITMPSPAGVGATNTQVSLQQYQQLTTKMEFVEELLRAHLQQTKTGTRALKEIDNKKSTRKLTKFDSTDSIQISKED